MGGGNYAKFLEEKSAVGTRVLWVSGAGGGLTGPAVLRGRRGFAVVGSCRGTSPLPHPSAKCCVWMGHPEGFWVGHPPRSARFMAGNCLPT
jgi:hypothetical protein